jgi:hypothetical protein
MNCFISIVAKSAVSIPTANGQRRSSNQSPIDDSIRPPHVNESVALVVAEAGRKRAGNPKLVGSIAA